MRVWIMLGIGALMLFAVVLPSGVWGATIDDVKAEMQKMPIPSGGGRLELRVPREDFGTIRMNIDQLCVSAGRLRPTSTSGSQQITDMGPVRPNNQYQVWIIQKFPSATGDEKTVADRLVSIPDCK